MEDQAEGKSRKRKQKAEGGSQTSRLGGTRAADTRGTAKYTEQRSRNQTQEKNSTANLR